MDADGHIIVWDSDDRPPDIKLERVRTIDASAVRLRRALFDRSGLHVYGCHDRGIIEWEINSGQVIQEIKIQEDVVTAVYPVPGENQCLTSNADGSMILWNMATGTQIRRFGKSSRPKQGPGEKATDPRVLDGHVGAIRDIVVTIDRRHVLSAGGDPVVFVWDLGTGKLVDRLVGHEAGIAKLELSPSNRFVASVGNDKSINFWSLYRTGWKLSYQWKNPGEKPPLVAIAPNGHTVAVAVDDESIRLLDFRNRRENPKLRMKGPEIRSMIFVPDGNLLCGTADGHILIWPGTLGK